MNKRLSMAQALLVAWFALGCVDGSDSAAGEDTGGDVDTGTSDDSDSDTGSSADTGQPDTETDTVEDSETVGDTETESGPEFGAACYEGPENYPEVPADLTLNTEQVSHVYSETASIITGDIFAVHYAGIAEPEAQWLLDRLAEVRCVSLAYGMADPPPVDRSWYYNVFVHTGKDGLGNGQGTDGQTRMPFLTLPTGPSQDPLNVDHEGFHIFQYRANSPGFEYAGDSQWFIEATAQWFATTRTPDDPGSFVEAWAIVYNPHLTLWHSFNNEAPGDPDSSMWTYGVRQYGLHTWLFYLTELADVPRAAIPAGFYANTDQLPQEYYYGIVGAEKMRETFADWTAHSRADFDYLTREQVARAQNEIDYFINQGNKVDPFVAELTSAGTAGAWQSPPEALRPRGWSFNTVRIEDPAGGDYELAVSGEELGSEAATSHLEGRVVVMYGGAATEFFKMNMKDKVTGEVTVTVNPGAEELYLLIVALPEHFSGNQSYAYQYRIVGPT